MGQKTEGHKDCVKTVDGVVIAKPSPVMNQSNPTGSENLVRKKTKIDFFHLTFFRYRENLRVGPNTEGQHDWMKTVGGVVITKPSSDRTTIQREIDESLSAKWSTWNTLTSQFIDD